MVFALLAYGCGQDSASSEGTASGGSGGGGASGSGGGGGSGGGTGGGDSGTECPLPAQLGAGEVCLEAVEGRVTDSAGNPVPDTLTTVCGSRQCNPGVTGTDGRFRVEVGFALALRDYSTLPHGRPNRTNFYFQLPLDATGPVIEVGDLPMLDLPATGPLLVVKTDNAGAPAQSVTSGDVTLEVADGVRVLLDVEDVVEGENGKLFRALEVPQERRDTFIDPALGAFALYAFTPFEAGFDVEATGVSATARLSFANRTGLAAGSAVEVLALGTYQYLDWVKPAAFEPVATASVTADGARIELDPGEGLRYLTWVALRDKP
jgi:hypothetical protein